MSTQMQADTFCDLAGDPRDQGPTYRCGLRVNEHNQYKAL
jgi:hypothetical protein